MTLSVSEQPLALELNFFERIALVHLLSWYTTVHGNVDVLKFTDAEDAPVDLRAIYDRLATLHDDNLDL